MFSDTHFHFNILEEESRQSVLEQMAANNTFFGMDIGTHCDDLARRQKLALDVISKIADEDKKKKAFNMYYFSAGIWPAPEAIRDRKNQIIELERQLKAALDNPNHFYKKVVAIGECGLDHHWNPSGVDGRCESDFDQELFDGEKEMFLMQLDLAKKYSLPVVVHSRDAFEGTVECLKDACYDNGIIHCYSYGLEEAKVFLDRGWYLAFGGGVTYTKKSKMDEMIELLRYVPSDRLLMETDAPYLTPHPHRGKRNEPSYIPLVLEKMSEILNLSKESLVGIINQNTKTLFGI